MNTMNTLKSSVQTKQNVVKLIKENQTQIESFGVKQLGLFGSYVREEQNIKSDVDLLVEFEAGQKTFDNFMGLSFVLEDLLQQPIELVTIDSLSPYIGPYITREVEYVTFAT